MSTTLFTLVRQLGFEAEHSKTVFKPSTQVAEVGRSQGRLVYSVISRPAEAV